MNWVTREDLKWGKTKARNAKCDKGLVIHYDGNNQNLANKNHSKCYEYWNGTRNFHMNDADHKWLDIGYSYGACPHGYIFAGRGLGKEQAAQKGGNTTYHSVTLMCGPTDEIPQKQIDAVIDLHSYLKDNGVADVIKGHRDITQTDCPGDILYKLISQAKFLGKKREDNELPKPEDVWNWDGVEAPPWAADKNKNWTPASYLHWTYIQINTVKEAQKALQKTLEAIADKLNSTNTQK